MAIAASFPNLRPSLLLDFANAKAVDPRVTFVRSTTAKYYDGVTTAKAEENLLLQSQTFNTTWAATGATVSPDTTTAPDGTTTADSLIETTADSRHQIDQSSLIGGLSTYTLSIFIKKGSVQYVSLYAINTSGLQEAGAVFDLDGVSAVSGGVGTFSATSASIVSVGSGWYRCSVVVTNSSTLVAAFRVAHRATAYTSGAISESYIGNTGNFTYLWGAQLEQRSAVTAYTPTTTQPITNYIPVLQTAAAGVPRIDHDPVTGECLGLLIEEQRTNLLPRSEEFSDAYWSKSGTSITGNIVVAPDGTLTGDLMRATTAISSHQIYSAPISISAGNPYTYTVYAKYGGYQWLSISANDGGERHSWFDLLNGVPGSNTGGNTSSMTPVGNGWYRCVVTRTVAAAVTYGQFYVSNTASVASFAGNGYSGIFIWGAQLEAGAFPTSYIPTVATQETRNADAASMTGTNFSSWYRADEGSFYLEGVGQATARTIAGIGQGNFQTTMAFNVINLIRVSGASPNVTLGTGIGGTVKLAAAIKPGNFAASANGAAAVADSTYQTLQFTANRFEIGQATGYNIYNGTIKKIAYYPQRLTNANLQALTA